MVCEVYGKVLSRVSLWRHMKTQHGVRERKYKCGEVGEGGGGEYKMAVRNGRFN